MDRRSISTLIAGSLALCAVTLIRVFAMGTGVFTAFLVANASFELFGIMRAAIHHRWKPCLLFVAWFCIPLAVGMYLIHLWHTLP
jgi:hypothetical protein